MENSSDGRWQWQVHSGQSTLKFFRMARIMIKSIGEGMRSVTSLVLVLSMFGVATSVSAAGPAEPQASEAAGSQAAAEHEDANAGANSINSKIEKLGRIKRFKVIDLRTTQRDGLLRVQATLQNGRKSQDIVYRARWLDQDGFSVWEDEAWKPLSLYDHQKMTLQFIAPTAKAVDFRIQVQGEQGHEKAHEKSSKN